MSRRGTYLAPILVPTTSCFINLPHVYIQTFLTGPDATSGGATVLELSWETIDGYVQRICVGWIGGIVRDNKMRSDIFELSSEFARCVGLQEHLHRMPQSFIGVHVVDILPVARQVNVEPCTPDDWELIQLHAGLIEGEILRQMCVVNDRQVHPIFVHHNILIHLRVTLPVDMEFARLTTNTEIIVAPNERKIQTEKSTTLDPEFYYTVSPILRVQQNQDIEGDLHYDEVLIHPQTFALLDGAIAVSASGPPFVALWNLRQPTLGTHTDSNNTVSCCVARLKCSDKVGRGRIVPNTSLSLALALNPTSSLQLRVLRILPLPVTKLTIHVRLETTLTADLEHAFIDWLTQRNVDGGLVLYDGACVRFPFDKKSHVAKVEVTFDSQEMAQHDSMLHQLEDVPAGALVKYAVIRNHVPFEVVNVTNPSAQQQLLTLEQALNYQYKEEYVVEQSLYDMARNSPAYLQCQNTVQSTLFRDESIARILLGVKPPGSALIHGDRGSGKTTTVRALAEEMVRNKNSLVHAVNLECRSLRGLKMESVKSKLTQAYEEATANAPGLVILDNLDSLAPEESEQPGPANEQSRRIAEHIVTLLQACRDRMWKTTLELHHAIRHEVQTITSGTVAETSREQKMALHTLLETSSSAMLTKSVATIATVRSEAALHKTLRCTSLFDHSIPIMSPNSEQREVIIDKLLRLKLTSACSSFPRLIQVDSSMDYGYLASLTEGYSLRDLINVIDRTLHQLFLRLERINVDTQRELIQADFTNAIEGFKPTALVGVDLFKSSVKWNDVGGLLYVRNALKDTLELPTRYAKLYDHTPIRLPAGMLLYGPPGCGKTLLANAVANECGLNFISVKGPEVLNKYIGASEQAIRDLFGRAASAAPSVLFLDEFDSIAPRRGADNTGVTDRLVNQLLTFLDGVESRKGVYVLAATSRPDMIDPALLRPGRLDKSLYCGFPNEVERLDILKAVGRKMEIAEEGLQYLSIIAQAPKSHLYSGADLQAIMYSAQLELVHEKLGNKASHSKIIMRRHLETAFANTKASTSESARREYETRYASFSKERNTDFAVATADASTHKSHLQHQRTALA